MESNEYNELREKTGYIVNYDNVGYIPSSTTYVGTVTFNEFNESYGNYIDTDEVISKLNSTNNRRSGPGLRQLLMDSKPEDFVNYYQYPTSPTEYYPRKNQYPSIADVIVNTDYDRICTTDEVKELLNNYGKILEKSINDVNNVNYCDNDIRKRYSEMLNEYFKNYLNELTKTFK